MKTKVVFKDKKWYNRTPNAEETVRAELIGKIKGKYEEVSYELETVKPGCCAEEYMITLTYKEVEVVKRSTRKQ